MRFGPIFQLGYIVRDLDEAMGHWTDVLGVGPFFVTGLVFDQHRYKGIDTSPELRLAFSYSGAMQIELIEQKNDAISGYRDFLLEHGAGLHHVAMLLSDFDADTARLEATGLRVLIDGKTASRDGDGTRFKFYDTALHNGTYVEVVDAAGYPLAGAQYMQQAAATWDGKDPVRIVG